VLLVLFSVGAMAGSTWFLKGRDFATLQRGGAAGLRRQLTPWQALMAYSLVIALLLLVLSPHLGLLLLSLSKVWSYSVLPDAYTVAHYGTVFKESTRMMINTLVYCGGAALLDVIIGTAIAYVVLRTRVPGRQWLTTWPRSRWPCRGGAGHRLSAHLSRRGTALRMGPLLGSALIFILAYSVRRLPYALRSCNAALSQVHLSMEEAAQNLGASRGRTIMRVVCR